LNIVLNTLFLNIINFEFREKKKVGRREVRGIGGVVEGYELNVLPITL
jgi:hypothetical protein